MHFTNSVLNKINKKKIKSLELTLHVGAGTFQPVIAKNVVKHIMHKELLMIDKKILKTLMNKHNEIIAIGTTTVRTLESLYWLGVKLATQNYMFDKKLILNQWEPYCLPQTIDINDSLETVLKYMVHKNLNQLFAETQIMIAPGYKYKLIKGMVTNFHLPKSTLLLLIAAFIGDYWRDIYKYALDNNFRFLSYGDCSLLLNY